MLMKEHSHFKGRHALGMIRLNGQEHFILYMQWLNWSPRGGRPPKFCKSKTCIFLV